MPSAPESLATRFADPWESTEAPIAGFGFTALTTHWRTKSHTSTVCEKLPRKNCGGSSLARKGQIPMCHSGLREVFGLNEKKEVLVQNFAFWSTWVPCGRLAGTTSRGAHPARTVTTTGAATTLPS